MSGVVMNSVVIDGRHYPCPNVLLERIAELEGRVSRLKASGALLDELDAAKAHTAELEAQAGSDLDRAMQADVFEARIAELEKERDQWQESSGQNYVRAQEAEAREEKLRESLELLRQEMRLQRRDRHTKF